MLLKVGQQTLFAGGQQILEIGRLLGNVRGLHQRRIWEPMAGTRKLQNAHVKSGLQNEENPQTSFFGYQAHLYLRKPLRFPEGLDALPHRLGRKPFIGVQLDEFAHGGNINVGSCRNLHIGHLLPVESAVRKGLRLLREKRLGDEKQQRKDGQPGDTPERRQAPYKVRQAELLHWPPHRLA
ncbi:MAG: hypothetical protein WBQ63_02195, partial [Candidatus Acidiferrales bacterium]